ncbi:short-chain dehydrogenase/reductase family oxidoreductase domain protein [Mycobacterium kansasii]|uniref:Short-chain dehydrogenase/reductase family oxidoreductase domain protein n=1 Tax=Mycobacterium kansasii TaxID=1768 RepID=A0A1V3W9H7_MYCKA|nr:short-chain dehydrogenase/reductase family oxidoreductase domain protein [Mycobacterium kansasii]
MHRSSGCWRTNHAGHRRNAWWRWRPVPPRWWRIAGVHRPSWTIETWPSTSGDIRDLADPQVFPVVPDGHGEHIRYSFEMAARSSDCDMPSNNAGPLAGVRVVDLTAM